MAKRIQTNTRLPDLTRKQLEEIEEKEGLGATQAIIMGIDHLYQEFQEKWKRRGNSAKPAESLPILEGR